MPKEQLSKIEVIEHLFIQLPDRCKLAAKVWLPADASKNPEITLKHSFKGELMKKTGEKAMHRKMEGYYKKEKCDVPQEKGQDPSSYDLILKLLGHYETDTRIIRDENNEVIGCLSVPVPNFRPVQSEEDPEQNLETQKVAEFVQMTLPLKLIQEDDLHFDSRTEEQSFVPRPFK